MENGDRNKLFAAILKLLRPLVRILLRNGIPFGAFADLARWVYVDVAMKEFRIHGRKQSVSRASIVTGLSRKEVHRLRKLNKPRKDEAVDRYHRAARVISGWVRDERFSDARGRPLPLPFDAGEVNFKLLVRLFSGDVPPRAVLDELLNVKAIEITRNGKIRLLTRAYVPAAGQAEKIAILGTDVADLIRTIDHNIAAGEAPFFQRKVSYDNVPAQTLPEFRKLSARDGQRLLEKLDRWLSQRDRDLNPDVPGTGRKRVGIGVYYFEEDLEGENPEDPEDKVNHED